MEPKLRMNKIGNGTHLYRMAEFVADIDRRVDDDDDDAKGRLSADDKLASQDSKCLNEPWLKPNTITIAMM